MDVILYKTSLHFQFCIFNFQFSTSALFHLIADRREAINHAIKQARANDLVLIAGKGHEDYQIIGREVFHFDDKEVAREALAARS